MSNTVKITLNQECWKFLYTILSHVFCTNYDQLTTVNELFAKFEQLPIDYDLKFAQLKQRTDVLEVTYQNQLKKWANEIQLKTITDKYEAVEKEKEQLASILEFVEFDKNQVVALHSYVTHVLSINMLDKDKRAVGVAGRHPVRMTQNILQELQNNI